MMKSEQFTQKEINKKIAELKVLIAEAKQEGFTQIAIMYEEELNNVIALAKLDGKLL